VTKLSSTRRSSRRWRYPRLFSAAAIGAMLDATVPSNRLRAPSRSVTPLTFEGGQRLPRLDHDAGRLTAATTLPHDLRGKLQDRLVSCGHRLLSLGSEFGLAECGRSTSLFHRYCIILDVRFAARIARLSAFCDRQMKFRAALAPRYQYAAEFPNLAPRSSLAMRGVLRGLAKSVKNTYIPASSFGRANWPRARKAPC
jgi:hypothetical protein